MADQDLVTSAIRQGVIMVARSQIGAHYLLGSAAATPGNQDGVWYRTGSVKLHPNAATGDRKDHGRTCPMVYAATYQGKKYRVCAGRSNLTEIKAKPKGDPANPTHIHLAQNYKWERPKGVIDNTESVFGECCIGIRHFDCISFVNWVLGNVQKLHYSIKHWINKTDDVGFKEVWAGDLLTKKGHIGIATGPNTVIHASTTYKGVIETKIGGGGWTRCGRLDRSYWRRYTLYSGTDTFDEDEVDIIEAVTEAETD